MSRQSKERQRLLRQKNKLWEKGFNSYNSEKTFKETFPKCEDKAYELQVYYLRCGWEKAHKDCLETSRRSELPICRFCGNIMEEYLSGYYCEDQVSCKNHIHKD